jgi:anti-anti-sigma factor
MQIRSFVSGSVKVIVLEGDINKVELKNLKDEFRFLHLFKEVLFDLSAVDFAGSSLVNLLAYLKNRFPADYGKIKIINPNEMVRELLHITGLDTLYPVFCEEESACAVV